MKQPFALYVHWPYCTAKCPYCDFNSHVLDDRPAADPARWAAALGAEIARTRAETGPRDLAAIFFGGGTPSLMPPDLAGSVIAAARAAWSAADDLEITLEANPGSVEIGRFGGFRDAGVNRISVGVQSLEDEALRALGRVHDAAAARRAIATAQRVFARVSFDLIYARQGQGAAAWRAELGAALAIGTGHLSLYQLTIEPGTVYARRHAAGLLPGLPDDDAAAALYELTQELCEAAGLPAYEISNHARPGETCRHNLLCWRGGDYAGIGPGAHGRLTLGSGRVATVAHRAPGAWLEAVATHGSGEARRCALDRAEIAAERVLTGLRLAEGLDLAALPRDLRPEAARIAALVGLGLVAQRGGHLAVTRAGRLLTDRIVAELAPAFA